MEPSEDIFEDEQEDVQPVTGTMPYNYLLGKYVPADEFFYD